MKMVIVGDKKHIGTVLFRHFQNQQYNIKFLLLSTVVLFLVGSPTNTSASTEKNKDVISKFYEIAEDKDANVRTELAKTIGKTGKPEALKLLEKMSTDKNPNVRKAVVEALGQTGRPEALKILKKIIKKEDKQEKPSPRYSTNIKATVIKAIMEINKEATRFLAYYPTFIEEHKNKKRYKNTRRYNTRKIKTFERNIYTQKIQKANNKAQAKKQAINSANQTKKEVFQLLSTLQTDKDESVRALVAKNAAQLADPTKALKLLEKIIKYEHKQSKQSKSYRYSYPSIKNTLIESIVKIHQETTAFLTYLGNKKEQKKQVFYRRKNYTGIYLQIIRYAKNKEKAEKQAINLAYQTKKKVFQLLNILAKDKAVEVRSTVVHSIKEIKNPIESLKLLENMIKIENKYSSKKNSYGVKNKAIKASLTIYKRAQNFLVNLGLQTKKQRKKRQHIYGTQGKIGIYKQMIQISTNKKKAKQQAINLAHQTKKKIFQLLNILAKDKEPSVRKQVVEGLPFIDELDAFDLLEKLMKDQDRDVRILAIQAIGKIN